MKKIILFYMLLTLSVASFSQQTNPSPTLTKQDYLKKSNNQKFLAWVLMGGGIAVVSITVLSNVGLDFGSAEKRASPVAPLTIAGVLMVGSIPVFITSHKNKKKAMSLSFKNEAAPQLQKKKFRKPVGSIINIKNQFMNKIILFTLLLTLSATLFSQQTNPLPDLTKQDYLKKSKGQKTTAWWFLGGGAALTVAGVAVAAGSAYDELGSLIATGESDNTYTTGIVLICIGIPAMLTSIPFFIASGRNKKKGMSLSFKNETTPQIQKSSFVNRSVPSLSLKINL